jgi:uracil-DNA glycosylase
MNVLIEPSWKVALEQEFSKPYFVQISTFLRQEKAAGKTIFPAGPQIFAAFDKTPLDKVRAVILGQDPYHGANQAHGLSFSVMRGVATPPSLANIYKEISSELNLPLPTHGNLEHWALQGVLLLNATLTVEAHKANSHSKIGWQSFTDSVIQTVSAKKEHVVFMLWGAYARSKRILIDKSRHLILESAHPSPLSAHNGFFGNGHFAKANQWLSEHGQEPIDWSIPS